MNLVIFYDGLCPLCSAEMSKLKTLDTAKCLVMVDITDDDFVINYPDIDPIEAKKVLHGQLNGQMLYGLDVTYWAWRLVGKGMWIAPLRWPLIKPLADKCYLFFARHRQRISHLLMPGRKCDDKCTLETTKKTGGHCE